MCLAHFYNEQLADLTIEPLTDVINIECADDQQLPYLGSIEAEVVIDEGLEEARPQPCISLVAPDIKYSTCTPITMAYPIIGDGET